MSHDALPIPDYDQLLLADVEQRVRSLDADQVKQLLEHERSHAARPAAVLVLEQQLTRIEGGDAPEGGPDPARPRFDAVGEDPTPHQANPAAQGPPQNPPSQGVPTNPAQPRR